MKNIRNYSPETKRFINKEKTTLMSGEGFKENIKVLRETFFESSKRKPKNKLPEVKPNLNSFSENTGKLKFIWFGHSTLLLNIGGKTILIDPVFSESASPVSFLV